MVSWKCDVSDQLKPKQVQVEQLDKPREFDGLKLTKITSDDFDAVMELLLDDFMKNEPLSNSLDLTREEGYWLFKELALSTIGTPVSYAFRAPDGKLAAVRLCNILERPTKDVRYPKLNHKGALLALSLDIAFGKLLQTQNDQQTQKNNEKAYEIIRIVNELESKTWGLVGREVKRLINVVILSCHRNWARRGLVSKLLECDLGDQKRAGIDGAISEATAYNSQQLFAKFGYVPIYEIRHDAWFDEKGRRIFQCRDKTTTAQLVFKKY
ncbi:unnamed protein product [Toxocara canis]|uniref:N-acetyltransferase domain-containing protein n=1 Tax=Toxocara canis TaxID=6265 RepID=A0A183UTZ9_TOXCA|nr:unnamed protein product [Toxocara canis]